MDNIIERALENAPYLKAGESGIIGHDLLNGYVLRIEYHTDGKTNVCDSSEKITSEKWDWERHGCKNNKEWRAYLNRCFWRNL